MVVGEDNGFIYPLACFETSLASLAAAGLAGHLVFLLQQWCGARAMALVAVLISAMGTKVVAAFRAVGAYVLATIVFAGRMVAIFVGADALLIISTVLAPLYGYLFCCAVFFGICIILGFHTPTI